MMPPKNKQFLVGLCAALLAVPALCSAGIVFQDDFESYALGANGGFYDYAGGSGGTTTITAFGVDSYGGSQALGFEVDASGVTANGWYGWYAGMGRDIASAGQVQPTADTTFSIDLASLGASSAPGVGLNFSQYDPIGNSNTWSAVWNDSLTTDGNFKTISFTMDTLSGVTGTWDPAKSLGFQVTFNDSGFGFDAGNKVIMDNITLSVGSVSVSPTVASPPTAASIQDTTATLSGEVTDTGGANVTERGIYWSTSNGFTPPGQGTKVSSTGSWGIGAFSENVTGLPQSSIVYYRSFAANSQGTSYSSSQASFQTEPSTQVSGLTISNISSGGMKIQWSGSGSGDGVIVVMKQASAVNSDPVDGTLHAANAQFGSGAQLGSGNYVLFRASGSSVVATNLSPSTTYYVAAYAYAGSGTGISGINYQQDAPATSSATTLAASVLPSPPTVANTTPSAIQTTTATLGGNVTAINNASITERGIYWSTSNGFTPPGQGTKVSSTGSWGTGTFTQNVTGLNPGNLIYYKAFAVNSAGTTYTSQAAFQTEPSVQASNPNFTVINDTSATLQWTSGNGDGTLVVIKGAGPTTTTPVDGTAYTADPGYGNGDNIAGGNYVVYRSSGNSVTLTNLEPNNVYYVSLYEYAGAGPGLAGINYQQDAPVSTSLKTLVGQSWMGHNRKYGIDCDTCHGTHTGFGVAHDEEQQATTCGQCHNPTGVASNTYAVALHYDSASNVLADCGDCHEVHRATAGSQDLSEMVTYDSHTSTTATNLYYFRADTNRIPQSTGPGVLHAVGSGSSDFAFSSSPYNGACQVCHTTTSHHTNTGGDVSHYIGQVCTDCHAHDDSFAGSGGGGTDCISCHTSAQGSHRAVISDFSLAASHIPGGAATTNDCMTCHLEEYGNAYHGNTTTDLRNVDTGAAVSIAQPFSRNTSSATLEADVVNLQNNFCLPCHDANGANGDTTPFSTGNSVLDIKDALSTGNAYFHPVRGPGNNPLCNSSTMKAPWNQTNGHDMISCFDCHGINAHGSANNNMLRVNISGPTDYGNTSTFCTTCHNSGSGSYHTSGGHFTHSPYSCRGCHSGQVEVDVNNDWNPTTPAVNVQNAALDIHGGNFIWPAGTGKPGAGTTSKHFVNGGNLEGWSSGSCYPDNNCQHRTGKTY